MSAQHATLTLLVFQVGPQRYALPINDVNRIIDMVEMLDLPGAPPLIQGLINVQGEAVPVLDMRERLGLPRLAYELDTPIILAHMYLGETRLVGLVVDTVHDVVEVGSDALYPLDEVVPPGTVSQVQAEAGHLVGVAKVAQSLLLVLNVRALVEYEQLASLLAQTDKLLDDRTTPDR